MLTTGYGDYRVFGTVVSGRCAHDLENEKSFVYYSMYYFKEKLY